CDADTASVIPATPFASVGTTLASQWAAELTQAGGTLFVTTCVVGGTADVGWTDLQFIAGYDYFPSCLPTAPQDVAGMAMLETTVMDCQDTLSSDCNRQIRAEYTDGLYFLTLYADLDTTMTAFVYTNSDGTTQKLVSNPKRTLITGDGHTVPDDSGRDYIITSRPLGSR
ncbi:hypothetical protein As57867_007450, partial [Aphanomyces stellatus]